MFGNFSKKTKKSKKILQFKKKNAIIMYDCIFMCIFRRMNLALYDNRCGLLGGEERVNRLG